MSNSKEDGPKGHDEMGNRQFIRREKTWRNKARFTKSKLRGKRGVLLRVLYTNVLFIHVNLQPNLLSVELGPGHLNTTLSRRQD